MINLKGYGRKQWWPNFKVLSDISLEGLRKTTKKFNQDSRSPRPRIETGA
jgi:hypothetical protein